MKPHDIYTSVTETIIELLSQHQQDWNRPWIALGQDNDYARNPATAKYYRGINQFLLSFELMHKGYLKNIWLTFNQIKKQGGHVLKGEKSTPVIFYKPAFINEQGEYTSAKVAGELSPAELKALGLKSIPILKLYRVFNVAQTKDLDEEYYSATPHEPLTAFEQDERAELLIQSTGADIEIIQSNQAYYDPHADKIRLPLREQFKGETEPFYATALHELGHWTGHKTRLDRTFGTSFGDPEYATEELIAELTSAFCCASLGFSKTITQNAAYINSWLGILKQDHKAVVKAAAQAQRASDFILASA